MSNHELTAKTRGLRDLQSLIEKAPVEAEAIKDTLKAHTSDSNAPNQTALPRAAFGRNTYTGNNLKLARQFLKLKHPDETLQLVAALLTDAKNKDHTA